MHLITAETHAQQEKRHTFVGVKGDLRVELHYVDVHDGEGVQACLYLFKFNAPKDGVYIPFNGMWVYAQRGAIDTVVRPVAKKLYGFVQRQDEYRVLDAIFDYLEDLKNHKPPPGRDRGIDEFLQECDDEGLEFFVEDGMGRKLSLT
jgi:hypothetical protein